jgi:Uma2 family endonuclease
MRVKAPTALRSRYPDLSVVCGEPIFELLQGQFMLVNPVLLIEALLPSTTAYDLGENFTAYQSIPTFGEYLLIAQTRPHVIRHHYQAPGQWLRTEVSGIENAVPLETLGLTLPLAEIYERVQFQPEPPLA